MSLQANLDDIQGNILAGFNCEIQLLVGLRADSLEAQQSACRWLSGLASEVASVNDVTNQRSRMRNRATTRGMTWLCVSMSKRLLDTQNDVFMRDNAFNGGLLARAPSLGDRSDPSHWKAGGTTNPIDVFLIVAGNDQTSVEERGNALVSNAEGYGLVRSYQEFGHKLDGREHFGFADGVSQPRVHDYHPEGDLSAGNFVYGYPRRIGGGPYAPHVDPRGVTHNGSLLVFRRLRQDVRAFQRFCTLEAARISEDGADLSSERLAALVVGRWPSGTPVQLGQATDPHLVPPDNAFDFLDDLDGTNCPIGAHIRKVNPRQGNSDVVEVPRIMRRGIPYGVEYDQDPEGDRGLLFICFQTSIANQFEFITRSWMNSVINPGPGNDLLVGLSSTERSFTITTSTGLKQVFDRNKNWIFPSGGGYFFAPSRSGLQKLDAGLG